jgi:hypothetical protein
MAQRAKELLREPAYGIRDGRVFLYFASFDSDDANVSDWLLWFFQRFFILTATAPRHSVEQR